MNTTYLIGNILETFTFKKNGSLNFQLSIYSEGYVSVPTSP